MSTHQDIRYPLSPLSWNNPVTSAPIPTSPCNNWPALVLATNGIASLVITMSPVIDVAPPRLKLFPHHLVGPPSLLTNVALKKNHQIETLKVCPIPLPTPQHLRLLLPLLPLLPLFPLLLQPHLL